jgi:D-alanyl-D-alanine carboxypeptidase/D-alanyl-D-alanine-endopeptidase (penicillin-binding protein 4)
MARRLAALAPLASLTALAAVAPSATAATGPIAGLDPAALEVMNQPAYANGQWLISVRDMDTGEQLISHNADALAEPGSVVKTYSMGAGWLHFGPDHQVVTPVKRRGKVVDGRLRGDLILVGKGDMTMGGRTKADGKVAYTNLDHNDANDIPGATLTPQNPLAGLDQLAEQVRAAGVRSVSGDVIVDDRLFETFELVPNGPVTPIVINNNLIDFTTTPGKVGETASIAMRPKVAPWKVTSQVKTVKAGGETDITVTSPRHGRVVLSGTVAADGGPVVNTYAFRDPARYARTALIEALGRAGVRVEADPVSRNPARLLPSERAVVKLPSVAKLRSLSLDQEATYTLKVSYNRGAQTMICLLAVEAGSKECNAGLAKAAEIWRRAGLDTGGAVLIDGSGLSGNLITMDNQVQLQTIMGRRPDAARWRATLPILGVDGSLSLVQPGGPATGKVFAKTGTLAQGDLFNDRLLFPAKGLGGYIDAASGRRLVFSIVAADSVFATIDGAFAANDDVGKVVTIIQQSF